MKREDTIGGVFWGRVRQFGSRTALQVKRGGRWQDITWEEWGRNVKLFAMGLMALGLKEREKVALLSENRPEWTYADLAVLSANAVDVPVYATNIPEQVEHIIKDSGSRFIVVSTEQQLDKVREIKGNVPELEQAIIMDPEGKPPEEWILTFAEIQRLGEQKGDAEAFEKRLESVKTEDLATLIYTSGTTGAPKGVMLTHNNFISNVQGAMEILPLSRSDIALSFLPLSHSFERLAGYYTMMTAGGTVATRKASKRFRTTSRKYGPP